jgi:hypothetical protein
LRSLTIGFISVIIGFDFAFVSEVVAVGFVVVIGDIDLYLEDVLLLDDVLCLVDIVDFFCVVENVFVDEDKGYDCLSWCFDIISVVVLPFLLSCV